MFINQPSETISDVEATPTTSLPSPSPQLESTNEVDNCETFRSIISTMKEVREVTSCSPDTTTSATPQFLLTPDRNDSFAIETIEETESNERFNCNKNLEKRLRMTYDDCDIPSPAYSPYGGKRKNNKIARSNIALELENVGEAITPIDLRLNVTKEGGEMNDSTNATISSSQSTLGLISKFNDSSLEINFLFLFNRRTSLSLIVSIRRCR